MAACQTRARVDYAGREAGTVCVAHPHCELTQNLFHVQSNTEYTLMSGASGLAALCATYPNQVIRSRIQVATTLPLPLLPLPPCTPSFSWTPARS
jgi:hypothetical protein